MEGMYYEMPEDIVIDIMKVKTEVKHMAVKVVVAAVIAVVAGVIFKIIKKDK